MTILDRILPDDDADDTTNHWPVHLFMAIIGEPQRGHVKDGDWSRLKTNDSLTAKEISDLDFIIAEIRAGNLTRDEIHDLLILGELGTYNKDRIAVRLGLKRPEDVTLPDIEIKKRGAKSGKKLAAKKQQAKN